MDKFKIEKVGDFIYKIEKSGGMKVPIIIFASETLLNKIKDDNTLRQASNLTKLSGIIKNAIVLPDGHEGYGANIGSVTAFDLEKGIISPGGVGYDINCGVRVLATNISVDEFMKKRKEVLHDIFRTIPSGVGRGHKQKYSREEIIEVLKKGSEWALEKGFATKKDLEHTEERGRMKQANPEFVSERAIARGKPQLGTLGAGNHFLEIQKVDEIIDDKVAEKFGIKKDSILIMIHCGSRGLGHQVASDYIKLMEEKTDISKLPDRELVNAPVNSELGKKYLGAMACAVNFAFCNRQIIMDYVRKVFNRHFSNSKLDLIYDVAHNIAKIEEHKVNGKNKKLCVHRKGATRCFGPSRKEIPKAYKGIGQPVILPGSMGTASYILVGTDKSEELSFGSTAHGAGRIHSRSWAYKNLETKEIENQMKDKDIVLESGSRKGVIEEAPEVYKDIDEVVKVSHELGLAKMVARLKPLAVMKG